jgi:Zn-dependent peptidase ImmA (M78 family)
MNVLNNEQLVKQATEQPIDKHQATILILKRARQLVNEVIEKRGHDKPPFLPKDYAGLMGIKNIIKTDLGKTSGLLLRFFTGPVIKVNNNQSIARQNFSAAHEIGHILFSELILENYVKTIEHRTFDPQAKMKKRMDARERLCDTAASELLMPESIFRKHLLDFGVNISSVEKLAELFQVSLRAAVRRIAEVSPEPCIALVWEPQPPTNYLKLKKCIGPEGEISYLPTYTKIKYPSILHKALEKNSQVKCNKSFKIGTTSRQLRMESKGFGYDEFRCVLSLAFPKR